MPVPVVLSLHVHQILLRIPIVHITGNIGARKKQMTKLERQVDLNKISFITADVLLAAAVPIYFLLPSNTGLEYYL